MKKALFAAFLLPALAWADPLPEPAGGSPSFNLPEASTDTTSVARTGETTASLPPRAMTDSSADASFITLTRSPHAFDQLPASAEIITADEIRRIRARTAAEAVSSLTSFRLFQQGDWGSPTTFSLRGAENAQTMVLVDGRPVGGAGLAGQRDLSEIAASQIDRIEIVRSDASVLYGPGASGGVVNIITKRSVYEGLPISHLGMEGRSSVGQSYRIDAGSRYGPLDFFFFGDGTRQRGYRQNADAKSYNIGGNLGWGLGKGGKLLFDVSSYLVNHGIPGRLNPDLAVSHYDSNTERLGPTPSAREKRGTDTLRASYLLPLPGKSLLALRAFGAQRREEYENPDALMELARYEQNKGADLQLNLPWGFVAGGTYLFDRLDSQNKASPTADFVSDVKNWGAYVQETWAWKKITLIPGVRYADNSEFGDSLNPSAQALWDTTSWLRFSGSAAYAERAPTLDDVFTPLTTRGDGYTYQGNLNLRPEKTSSYDAGFELHQDSNSVKVSYFRALTSDLIHNTGGLVSTTVNVDNARRQGMEVDARKTLSARCSLRANYTFLENRGTPPGFSSDVPLRLSPRHSGSALLRSRLFKNLQLDNVLRYASAYYEEDNEAGSKMASTLTWDLRVQFPLRQLDLYVGVNDVTNVRYRERGGYPLPGRTIYGGFDLRLWG